MDPERQQPIEADGQPFFQDRERRAKTNDERAPGGTDDRPGLCESRAIDEHRDRQALEYPEIDGRGRIEDVRCDCDGERYGQKLQAPAHVAPAQRTAHPRQDDEESGEEVLGRRPGHAGKIGRETQESLDPTEFSQVEEEMVADHQDDGQAAQEVDLPDAFDAARSCHAVRIIRAAAQRQGTSLALWTARYRR